MNKISGPGKNKNKTGGQIKIAIFDMDGTIADSEKNDQKSDN